MQGKNVEKIIKKKPRKKTDLTRRIREEQRNLKFSPELLEDDGEGECLE